MTYALGFAIVYHRHFLRLMFSICVCKAFGHFVCFRLCLFTLDEKNKAYGGHTIHDHCKLQAYECAVCVCIGVSERVRALRT